MASRNSEAQELVEGILTKILGLFPTVQERKSDSQSAKGCGFSLTSADGAKIGELRVFVAENAPLRKLVYSAFELKEREVKAFMLGCFTESNSLVPHLLVEVNQMKDKFTFLVDLLTPIDVRCNIEYIQGVYTKPLTPIFKTAQSTEGITPASLSPELRSQLSSWSLAYQVKSESFAPFAQCVLQYFDHWCSLLELSAKNQLPRVAHAENLEKVDELLRKSLFNEDIDPFWKRAPMMFGKETSARLQAEFLS